MRRFLLISLIFFCVGISQAQTKLYYFLTADNTKVGVKNELVEIIIPADYPHFGDVKNDEIITSPTIEFYYLPNWQKTDFSIINARFGAVYIRKGQFLYNPLYCDNGPDYWFKGLRRYVENRKVGLVDLKENILTEAKWDMIWPFDEKIKRRYLLGT